MSIISSHDLRAASPKDAVALPANNNSMAEIFQAAGPIPYSASGLSPRIQIKAQISFSEIAGRKQEEFAKLQEALKERDSIFNPDDGKEKPGVKYWNGKLCSALENQKKAEQNFNLAKQNFDEARKNNQSKELGLLQKEFRIAKKNADVATGEVTLLELEFQDKHAKVQIIQDVLGIKKRIATADEIPDEAIRLLLEKEREKVAALRTQLDELAQIPDAVPIPENSYLNRPDASLLPPQYLSIPAYADTPFGMHELLRESVAYFDQMQDVPIVHCPIKQATTDREALVDIYHTQGFDGACVGEYHNEACANHFIFDNLPHLKELGITTIFMEDFKYELQYDIDLYLHTGEFTPALKAFVNQIDASYPLAPVSESLRKAKEAGIRIVGINSNACQSDCYGTKNEQYLRRRYKMHYLAEKIVHHEKGTGKFIALMGIHHSSRLVGESRMGISSPPGLAELLATPCIIVRQDEIEEVSVNQDNLFLKDGMRLRHAHLSIKRKQPAPA